MPDYEKLFRWIPLEDLLNPVESGLHMVYKDYWWVVSEGETLWVRRTSGRLVPLANVDYEIVKILPGAEKGRLVYIPFIYRKVAKDEI